MSTPPLQGIKVVEFGQNLAGPYAGQILAFLGAEVVKIENPGVGDPGRRLQKGKPDNDPWYFHQFNANKKSLTLNLKSARGLEIVCELLKKADLALYRADGAMIAMAGRPPPRHAHGDRLGQVRHQFGRHGELRLRQPQRHRAQPRQRRGEHDQRQPQRHDRQRRPGQ